MEGEAPLRVMLVDDHALVRSAIRQALDAPDVEVVAEARNAEEALELAPQLRPDLLLLDIDLPGMTGIEAVRELAPVTKSLSRYFDRSPPRRCFDVNAS